MTALPAELPPRRGRRPKVPDGRKGHITIRLHPKERERIDEHAARLGITAGSYVRQVVLDAPVPRQGRRPNVNQRALADVLGALGHIGSNINQAARVLNGGGEINEREFERALATLAELRAAALEAMGRDP